MAKEKVDLAAQLRDYRFANDVLQRIPCSKSECKEYSKLRKEGLPLPEDVSCDETYSPDYFYRVEETELSDKELAELMQYRQLALLKTIRNGMVFFVTLAVIGLIGWFMVFAGMLR